MAGERPAAANPGTTLSEHKGRWGVWAQGDCAFFEVRDGAEACELYRDALAHAQLGISTHPPCVDGLRARVLAGENRRLRRIVADLLGSADCAWEADGGGHDWAEACEAARAALAR